MGIKKLRGLIAVSKAKNNLHSKRNRLLLLCFLRYKSEEVVMSTCG